MEVSNSNTTEDHLHDWNTYLTRERVLSITLRAVLLALGILGNVAVFVIYWTKLKNERRERYFIPYLAIADLCATTVSCSSSIIMSTRHVTFPSGVLCKILWYTNLTTTSTSAVYLLVICVFRYRKVCILSNNELELKYKRLITFGVLLLICVMGLPLFFIYGERKISWAYNGFNVSGITCSAVDMSPKWSLWKQVYLSIIMIVSIAIVVAMVVLYSKIGRVVYKSVALAKQRHRANFSKLRQTVETKKIVSASTSSGNTVTDESTLTEQPRKLTIKRAKHNFTYMFFTIVFLYVITVIPSVIIMVVLSFRDARQFWLNTEGIELTVLYLLSEFYILNHVTNPVVYLYFDIKFRNELKNLFSTHCFARMKEGKQ